MRNLIILLFLFNTAHAQIIGVVASSKIKASPLLTNLVAYYKLDESSGSAVDQVSANNGTTTDITYSATGIINTSYQFSGLSSYVTLPQTTANALGSGDWSINFWVYGTSFSNSPIILGGGNNGARLGIQTDGTVRLSKLNCCSAVASSLTVSTSAWHMVTATFDGSTKSLIYYIDNVASTPQTFSQSFTDNSFYVLGAAIDNTANMSGKLDEYGMWKKVLTTTEVTALYNSGSGKAYPF